MKLRPKPISRLANAAPGAVVVVFAIAPLVYGSGPERAEALIAVPGLLLMVRGYNLSVEMRGEELIVHGYLRTRVLRRADIVEVTDAATVVWTDVNGRGRRTPMMALKGEPGMLPQIAEHHRQCVGRVQTWLRSG